MPASFLLYCRPTAEIPVARVQASAIQAMFLQRMQTLDASLMPALHDVPGSRPFTLSPLGLYGESGWFQGFRQPREAVIPGDALCYLRVTVLDDGLISCVRQGFQPTAYPEFTLGDTPFRMADSPDDDRVAADWQTIRPYAECVNRALACQRRRTLRFQFLTPTAFRQGSLDLPVPVPRLVFQSYKHRFQKFYDVRFAPDFEQQVEAHVEIAVLRRVRSAVLRTRHARSVGFTGDVAFRVSPHAPPEFRFQINVLAEYAPFCGTGKKTALGMGQTLVN